MNIDELENELRFLKDFLPDAERSQPERWTELDLERQIKDLVYDVQDISQSLLIYRRPLEDKVGFTLEREIQSIRRHRLEPICRMIRTYTDLQLHPKQPTKPNQVVPSVLLNREVPPIRLKKIVGFENESATLIRSLLEETEELDVISITGMPGIGKTTLAWKIYNDETIRREFPTRIWVDIPFHFKRKDLYLNILKEFIKQGMVGYEKLKVCLDMPPVSCSSKESCLHILDAFFESGRINDGQLVHGVRACLEMSKFLLVMDDVYCAESLRSVVVDLSLKRRGKVMITSFNTSVCVDANVTRKPHVLRFLNEKESWDLLELEVFGKLGDCPGVLKSTGEGIAKNCDGSPLAIMAVGASLGVTSSTVAAKYLNHKWWKKVSENVIMYLRDYDQQRVFKSIELSYIKLTQSLQDCFLYLGVFPQGHEIPVRTLIRLWIAERLVQDGGTLAREEAAQKILNDLINRNLVMVVNSYPNGQMKTCRLHRLLHGFCNYKAAKQGFYHEIKMSGGGAIDRQISLAPNHYRLCIYSHLISEFLSSPPQGRRVRSILCLNKEHKVVMRPKECSNIHESFKLLGVLECNYVSFTKFPTMLTKLMNLRYISLSSDDLNVIPKTISSLRYLETLVVDTQRPSLKIKANIWRMVRLRHLVTKAAITLAIRGAEGEIGKMLQTLTRLAPSYCTDVFTRAPNLKTLGVRGNLADLLDDAAISLRKLQHLQHLKLISEPVADRSQLHLQQNYFPPNLKRLTLSGTNFEWHSMSILGNIGSLEILKLKNNAFSGESWTSTDGDGFVRLGFLLIATTDLVYWNASADCFPSLKCLVLKDCTKLQNIPFTFAKSLDTLDVDHELSRSAMDSAREIRQEISMRQ